MKRFLPLLALTALFAACGDDSTKSDDVADSVSGDSTADSAADTTATDPGAFVDPASVRVFTSEEVCTLVSPEVASQTLAVDVSDASPFEASTPQCSYNFTTTDGTLSNLTLAVQRPIEDLGAAGKAGFDIATSLVIFDTPYEPLAGLGDLAAVSASATFTIIAVLAGDQVFTIATSAPIAVDQLVAFGNAVVEGLANPDGDETTEGSDSDTDPNAIAEAKVRAALDSLPAEWLGTIASDLGQEGADGSDIVFAPCLGPDDYNLDDLDADSAASWELDAAGPATGSPFGGQQASVEARVFTDVATADSAYAVLEKILGTNDGRECLAREVPGQLAGDAPAGTTFDSRVEGTSIGGADVGARLVVTVNSGGVVGEFYVDLVAAHSDGASTVFATFVSFGTPVDQVVATDMFQAALAGG